MENLTYGIQRGWYRNHQIVAYSVDDIGIATMFRWSESILETLEDWPAEYPYYLALHDLSHSGVSMPFLVLNNYNLFNPGATPMGKGRFENFLGRRPKLQVRLALVVSSELSSQITLRNKHSLAVHERVDYNVFTGWDGAMSWLEEFLA